jgi:hypothetical protein
MCRIFQACAVAIFALTLSPANAVERILLFVSDVRVERNGDLVVTETIKVQVEGQKIRRGILRDFAPTHTGSNGASSEAVFEIQSVARDGTAEKYVTEKTATGVRARIGNADKILTNGPHEYVIRYRTTRQIGFLSDFDELYWNATGTNWTFGIDVAEARISLPDNTPIQRSAFYTGPDGAADKDATIVEQGPGLIVVRTTKALPPGSGLTVAAGWAKGIVQTPR